MDSLLTATLVTLAMYLPLYITWLVGLILAIVKWKKIPKVSLLTVIAIVTLFLVNMAGTIFSMMYPYTAHQNGISTAQIGIVTTVVGIINILITTTCWGLLLAAIFGWRKPAA
jgi:hypothetical protein